MAAYNNTIDFTPSATPVLVTASNITSLTFKNVGGETWWLAPTAGAVPPSDRNGAIPVASGEGSQNLVLADTFPGVTGANRVYVIAPKGGRGFFSHG